MDEFTEERKPISYTETMPLTGTGLIDLTEITDALIGEYLQRMDDYLSSLVSQGIIDSPLAKQLYLKEYESAIGDKGKLVNWDDYRSARSSVVYRTVLSNIDETNQRTLSTYQRDLERYQQELGKYQEVQKRAPLEALTASESYKEAMRRRIAPTEEAYKQQSKQQAIEAQVAALNQGERPSPTMTSFPPMPGEETVINQALGAAPSSNLQRYMTGQMGTALTEFDTKYPGAREAWWRTLNAPSTQGGAREGLQSQINQTQADIEKYRSMAYPAGYDVAPYSQEEINQLLASQDISEQLTGVGSQAYLSAVERLPQLVEQGTSVMRENPEQPPAERIKTVDPLLTFLKSYPWYKEFIKLPAAQRGYMPRRYAPGARWVTG